MFSLLDLNRSRSSSVGWKYRVSPAPFTLGIKGAGTYQSNKALVLVQLFLLSMLVSYRFMVNSDPIGRIEPDVVLYVGNAIFHVAEAFRQINLK